MCVRENPAYESAFQCPVCEGGEIHHHVSKNHKICDTCSYVLPLCGEKIDGDSRYRDLPERYSSIDIHFHIDKNEFN